MVRRWVILLLAAVPLAAAGMPADTWVKRDPGGLEDVPNRIYSGAVAGGGFLFYWGGGHQGYGGNDVDAYDIAANEWIDLTAAEDWKHAGRWSHIYARENGQWVRHGLDEIAGDSGDTYAERIRTAIGGGWTVPYLSPRGRPLTAHIYQGETFDPATGRFCINYYGLWCYDPAKADRDDAWEQIGPPPPSGYFNRVNLQYDPDLDTFVSFSNNDGRLRVAVFDRPARSWRTIATVYIQSATSSTYSGYDADDGLHVVYAAEAWRRVNVRTGEVLPMSQWKEAAGGSDGSMSLEYAPELGRVLVIGRIRGNLEVWTYDAGTDTWELFPLKGAAPAEARANSDVLERDDKTGVYVFLAQHRGATYVDPRVWTFTLSGTTQETADCPHDACVGGTHQYSGLQAAVDAAPPGGTVGVAEGVYDQCAVVTKGVTIKPLAGRPVFRNTICDHKGILVSKASGTVTVEGLELRGARDQKAIWLHNGAGTLILRDVKVHDSGMGVFAGPEARSLRLYGCELWDIWTPKELSHFVYAAAARELVVEGSYLHGGSDGHFIKAKAVDVRVRYNFIHQQGHTDANLINTWGCGSNRIIGNAILSDDRKDAVFAIDMTKRKAYGDLVPCPVGQKEAVVAYNSFWKRGAAKWSALLFEKYGTDLTLVNNVIAGAELLRQHGERFPINNRNTLIRGFADERLHLPAEAGKPAVDAPVVPDRQYRHPAGTAPRGNGQEMGAYQTSREEG